MTKIEHIGIAVADLAQATPLYEALLGTPCYKTEEVASERVRTAFFKKGDQKIELLEAANPESAIAKYVAKKLRTSTTLLLRLTTFFKRWHGLKTSGSRSLTKPQNQVQTISWSSFYIQNLAAVFWLSCARSETTNDLFCTMK